MQTLRPEQDLWDQDVCVTWKNQLPLNSLSSQVVLGPHDGWEPRLNVPSCSFYFLQQHCGFLTWKAHHICKGWEKWVKSEHLCCNVLHFVLLLLCCSQALGNLFSQNPALTLNLWLLGRPGPESWCGWWAFWPWPLVPSRFQGVATGVLPVPWLPWRSSLEALTQGGILPRSCRSACCFFRWTLMLFRGRFVSWGTVGVAFPQVCFPLAIGQVIPVGPSWCRPSPTPTISTLHLSSPPSSLSLEAFFPKCGSDHIT